MMTYGIIRMDLPPVFPIPLCKLAPHPKYALRHRIVLASCLAQTAHPANDKQTWAEIHSLHINRSCNNRPSLGHCTRAECSSIGSSRLPCSTRLKCYPWGASLQDTRVFCCSLQLFALQHRDQMPQVIEMFVYNCSNACHSFLFFIFLSYLGIYRSNFVWCTIIRVCSVQWQWSATFLISIDVT